MRLKAGFSHLIAGPLGLNSSLVLNETSPYSADISPKLSGVPLFQFAPICFNSSENTSVGDLQEGQCRQIIPYSVSQNSHCLPVPKVFLCRTSIYRCLTPRWKGIGALVLLFPSIDISGDEEVPILLMTHEPSAQTGYSICSPTSHPGGCGRTSHRNNHIRYLLSSALPSAERGYPTGS